MGDPEAVREDRLLDGQVRLLQPAAGHRAGTDAVLLAAACSPRPGQVVADLGCGTGAVGLMIAARHPGCEFLFVERDPGLAALCRRNLVFNGIEGRARVVVADLLGSAEAQRLAGLAGGSCDWVATNPPFLDEREARLSPDRSRAAAHHMPSGGLPDWLRSAARLLKPQGRVMMIHRADKLQDCLDAMSAFGDVSVGPIYGRAENLASRILISGVKGSRAPLSIRPGLVLHDEEGRFTPQAEALHRS